MNDLTRELTSTAISTDLHLQTYLPLQTASIAFEVTESLVKSFSGIGTPDQRRTIAMTNFCDGFKTILSNLTDNANYCKRAYKPNLIRLEAALLNKKPMKE